MSDSFVGHWHGLFDGNYKQALREARARSSEPKASGIDLFAALGDAQKLLADWKNAFADLRSSTRHLRTATG